MNGTASASGVVRGDQGRLWMVVGSAAYIVLFQWFYINVVVPVYGYFGLTYGRPPLTEWIYLSLVALAPALWMPVRLTRPSQWLYFYLYIAVFVPSCLVPLLRAGSMERPIEELVPLWVVLFACFGLLGLVQRLSLANIKIRPLSPTVFWTIVTLMLVAAYLMVYHAFGASLGMAGAEDRLREQRLMGRDIVASSSTPGLLGYAMIWPGYALNPFLVAYGIRTRRYWLILIGVGGQIFLYSAAAARGVFGALAVLPLMIFLLRKPERFGNRCIWVVTSALGAISLASIVVTPWLMLQLDWAVLRTLVNGGFLTDAYFTFFSRNPYTAFSQVSGLGKFIPSPYQGDSIALMIGQSLGQPTNNANAHFLADGFASLGFVGMFLVTLLAAATFYLVDCLPRHVDRKLLMLIIAGHAVNLADLPVFTAILGQGLALSVLLAMYAPPISERSTAAHWHFRFNFGRYLRASLVPGNAPVQALSPPLAMEGNGGAGPHSNGGSDNVRE